MTAPTTTVPATIHIWMFAAAVASTVLVIPHAIIVYVWDLPAALVNLHMVITLGLWLAAVFFLATRQRPAKKKVTRESSPARSKIDDLELRLRAMDDER